MKNLIIINTIFNGIIILGFLYYFLGRRFEVRFDKTVFKKIPIAVEFIFWRMPRGGDWNESIIIFRIPFWREEWTSEGTTD